MTYTNAEEQKISDEIDLLVHRLEQLYQKRGGMIVSRQPVGEDDEYVVAWCGCGRNQVRPSEGQDTCDTCLVEA